MNSITSVIKKLSFKFSKNSELKNLFFVDSSKSPPRRIFELFFISFSILFLKIVTVEKINKLIKIVKKTFEILDLFLFNYFIKKRNFFSKFIFKTLSDHLPTSLFYHTFLLSSYYELLELNKSFFFSNIPKVN